MFLTIGEIHGGEYKFDFRGINHLALVCMIEKNRRLLRGGFGYAYEDVCPSTADSISSLIVAAVISLHFSGFQMPLSVNQVYRMLLTLLGLVPSHQLMLP